MHCVDSAPGGCKTNGKARKRGDVKKLGAAGCSDQTVFVFTDLIACGQLAPPARGQLLDGQAQVVAAVLEWNLFGFVHQPAAKPLLHLHHALKHTTHSLAKASVCLFLHNALKHTAHSFSLFLQYALKHTTTA